MQWFVCEPRITGHPGSRCGPPQVPAIGLTEVQAMVISTRSLAAGFQFVSLMPNESGLLMSPSQKALTDGLPDWEYVYR